MHNNENDYAIFISLHGDIHIQMMDHFMDMHMHLKEIYY